MDIGSIAFAALAAIVILVIVRIRMGKGDAPKNKKDE